MQLIIRATSSVRLLSTQVVDSTRVFGTDGNTCLLLERDVLAEQQMGLHATTIQIFELSSASNMAMPTVVIPSVPIPTPGTCSSKPGKPLVCTLKLRVPLTSCKVTTQSSACRILTGLSRCNDCSRSSSVRPWKSNAVVEDFHGIAPRALYIVTRRNTKAMRTIAIGYASQPHRTWK